jgi:Ycf66 protein N-terminus
VFTPAVVIFGMILIIASIGLFLTSKFKPELYQDSDNIYAVIGFVCGLILVFSLDLGAAMIFQQMLMIGALITIMWQFLQARAENKRLKGGGRSVAVPRERESAPARRSYAARLDDEPEYPIARGSRRFDGEQVERQFQPSSYEEDYGMPERRTGRMLPEYNRAKAPDNGGRQRSEYDGFEDRSYGQASYGPARDDDWSNPPQQESDWERAERPRRRNEGARETSRKVKDRRRSSLEDSADEPAAKSTAYVDYEPIDNSEEAVQFPSQY